MRPKKHETTGSGDLFGARLDQIINMRHELVQLAGKIDWKFIAGEIAPLYSEGGRPGIATQFVIRLFFLKHIYGLSDEGVCERWVYDPYFQHFTGEEFFQHEFPHERSDLSHWRKRLGGKLELLLAESLRVAHESGALRTKDLARVTVDVRLRQSYVRIAKRAAMMAGRYAHAKQFNRHRRQLRILRTRLGRLIRDIRRKIAGNAELEAIFAWPLSRADQIRSQQQRQRGWKLYSFHAPEVECIGRGKARAPYEFGVKASVVTTNARAPVANLFCTPGRCPAILMTATRWAPSSKPLRGSPAARSSVPMSTRDTAATMPHSRTASSSQAKDAGSSAASNASSRGAPPSRR